MEVIWATLSSIWNKFEPNSHVFTLRTSIISFIYFHYFFIFLSFECLQFELWLWVQGSNKKLMFLFVISIFFTLSCRFILPPSLIFKNFEGLDLGRMEMVWLFINANWWLCLYHFLNSFAIFEQTNDSGIAAYFANQIDRSLSWKVQYIWFELFSLTESVLGIFFSTDLLQLTDIGKNV